MTPHDTALQPVPHAAAAHRRPRTLREVAEWGKAYGQIDAFLREFLDEFYIKPEMTARAAMLQAEPALSGAERTDAYLAAVAEHLSFRNKLMLPD